MKIITIISSARLYEDRVRSICGLDQSVTTSLILTKEIPDWDLPLQNTRFITPDRPKHGLWFWLWAARTAKREMSQDGPEGDWIVIEHLMAVSAVFLRLLYRSRCTHLTFLASCIFTYLWERGWDRDQYARPLHLKQKLMYYRFFGMNCLVLRLGLYFSNGVIANSPFTLEEVRRFTQIRKVYLWPNAVHSPSQELTRNPPRTAPATTTPIPEVILPCNMQPAKGVALALELFQRLSDQQHQCRLLLLGTALPRDKSWFQQLLKKYAGQSNIEFVGRVPFQEMQHHYRQAKMVILPTFYEGSPRVIYEAALYGCPIVASDLPGIRIIDPGEDFIGFFPAGDLESFHVQVTKLLEDDELRKHRSQKGKQIIQDQFSPEKGSERLWSILSEVASGEKIQ